MERRWSTYINYNKPFNGSRKGGITWAKIS
jgi:hypothetical protein